MLRRTMRGCKRGVKPVPPGISRKISGVTITVRQNAADSRLGVMPPGIDRAPPSRPARDATWRAKPGHRSSRAMHGAANARRTPVRAVPSGSEAI